MTTNTQRADALLADLPRPGRGRLKVFLGAAPGVGKTYAMLQAAHDRQRQGIRVLAGVVETHGRRETEALLVGLPQQPLLRREHRGVLIEALDLDAVLAAAPQLLLIDELAHSNAPGSRHAKRWQDVQELLGVGIDVYTTVNVQHLEGLNDQVRDITGVRVRETLPDWVVQEAFELVLVDLPARELLERLRDGKVYVPEQARAAIDAFFSQTNLNALRELALQTAAAQVDADLAQGYQQRGQAAPPLRGRLLVGVSGNLQAERLVRHASRVAQRRHLPWSLLHVDNGKPQEEAVRTRLQYAQQLAERLGGEVITLRGEDAPALLLRYAREHRASLVLVGQSRRRRWRAGLASRLLAQAQGMEINILDRDVDAAESGPTASAVDVPWRDYGLAALATVLASALAWGVSSLLALPNISLVFLAAVLLVAIRSSIGPALACAGLSFVSYDFLFIPPRFSLSIQREEDVLTLLFFLLMAALTGNLAARQRRQLQALRDTRQETDELLGLSRRLAAATDRQAVLNAARQHFAEWRGVQVCVLERQGSTAWNPAMAQLSDTEQAAASWAWQHQLPAGRGTGTLPVGHWWWWPLALEGQPLALLGVRESAEDTAPDHGLSDSRRRLLAALGQPLAQALARARLADQLEAARLHGETEQLRSALLASVSHDLRTPLTAMRGSIDSLLALGEAIPRADRQELLEGTRDEAERLDRYIQNLLDMTRLGHGALKLSRDWVAPGDIVASSLQRLRAVLGPLQVSVHIPVELPLLYVHAALIEQALVNVLENAARFSPPEGRLEVTAQVQDEQLQFTVADEGPGIPEDERAQIFDMFYTAARGDRGGQGTGLGLAICQGMIGAHGGQIVVGDGIDGRGTRIALCLPLQRQPGVEEDR
ncbi:sensor histidine kinase KdpD [Pseudomonas sp. dw_358]|uniref:sensor histidine kinase n=1 Tax=Pseudomonas sp. dw_358 TaxID=2720083 RepID=UPI001BD3FA71|nr:sensor histidine kinase KdpD [Pseudomonas sp. dw_358]